MIKYQLVCAHDHTFDAWFRDSAAYDAQAGAGEVLCPACGTSNVSKALMAPRLARRKGAEDAPKAAEAPATPATSPKPAMLAAAMGQALRQLREVVEKSCDNVGDKFAEEARKIHYGEAEARGIYGQTTPEEAEDLRDEGVEFVSVPWARNDG